MHEEIQFTKEFVIFFYNWMFLLLLLIIIIINYLYWKLEYDEYKILWTFSNDFYITHLNFFFLIKEKYDTK